MNWPTVKLDELCHVVTKGTTPTSIGYEHSPEGVPFLRIQNLQGNTVSLDNVLFIDNETHKALKRSIIKAGDLLITIAGTIGRTAIVPDDFPECNCNQAVAIIRFDTDRLLSSYLLYWLNSVEAMEQIAGKKVTATISNLSLGQIRELKIPLPPLETQKQIAAVLEKADQLRKDCKLLEQELNSLAQSVFIEMFGDPVTNPKGWVKRELSEMLSVKHGFAFKSEFFTTEGEYVLLTPGNFKEEGGYLDRGEKQKYYVGKIPKGYLLEKNDLLLAMTEQAEGLLGSSILVPESNKYLHNQRLGLIKFKDTRQNAVFYSYLFNSKSVRFAIHSSSTGTKVKHTSPTKLEAIQVGVPPIALQNKFESIIRAIEKNIVLNNKAKSDYEQSFNALMQKAFNGELNLVNAKT